jgi:hypothetical protein
VGCRSGKVCSVVRSQTLILGAAILAAIPPPIVALVASTRDNANRDLEVGAFIVWAHPNAEGVPEGLLGICSGALIHERVFLTAGHRVGRYAEKSPTRSGDDRHAGICNALCVRETAPSSESDVEQLEIFRRYELVFDRHPSPRSRAACPPSLRPLQPPMGGLSAPGGPPHNQLLRGEMAQVFLSIGSNSWRRYL